MRLRRIRAAATFLVCAVLCAEGLAAEKSAPNKSARPPARHVRTGGKKKAAPSASKKAGEPAATEQPEETITSQPAQTADGRDTIGVVLSRLARTPHSQMSDREIALKTAFEFVRALGRADGQKVSALLEVTGYQTIPAGDELPDEPGPRISPEAFVASVAARKPAPFETLPVDCIELVPGKSLRPKFPVVAAWMLPTDWAVLLKPYPDRPEWVHNEVCLVIRVRAGKPTIQGGTALGALLPTASPEPPPPKR